MDRSPIGESSRYMVRYGYLIKLVYRDDGQLAILVGGNNHNGIVPIATAIVTRSRCETLRDTQESHFRVAANAGVSLIANHVDQSRDTCADHITLVIKNLCGVSFAVLMPKAYLMR